MCLPLGCWLCCMSQTVDDDPAPASRTTRNGASHYNGNGGHHYSNGNGYLAHGKAAAAAEADRKASNDVRRGPAAHHAGAVAVAVPRGWHGHGPATGAQEKIAVAAYPYAGADEMLKQQPPAAWNGKAAAADGHGARGGAPHNYYERAQLPAHREDAVDYHYTASTATADHERY